jgi:hypothetical protein
MNAKRLPASFSNHSQKFLAITDERKPHHAIASAPEVGRMAHPAIHPDQRAENAWQNYDSKKCRQDARGCSALKFCPPAQIRGCNPFKAS